jgi:hypothetical protein
MTVPAAGSRFRHADKLAWRDVAGEVILIHPARALMYPFNPAASRIWTRLDGKRDAAAIADEIAGDFAVDETRALRDVLAFLGELAAAGLVVEA